MHYQNMPIRPAVILHLHVRPRPEPGGRERLLAFLKRVKPYYESPGGIRMRLLASLDDPDEIIEAFEYDTVADYEADDERVRNDPPTKEVLAEWRSLIAGPPRVEVWRGVEV